MNNKRLSQVQIEVVEDYLDLLKNGYINMFAVYQDTFWVIKVRHLINGRILTLRWSSKCATLSEGKKVLKNYAREKALC